MAARRLSARDRELFSLIAAATFTNPFSAERRSLDAAIAEGPDVDPTWVPRMLERLGTRTRALLGEGPFELAAFAAEDRPLVETALLFETFHRYVDDFDRLIARGQREATPRVDFARECLRELGERGNSVERALRLFELFFQLRRAFYFITRGLVGKSSAMKRLRSALWQAVFTHDVDRYQRHLWNRMEDFSTLLLGETGSGKGAAAAAIGRSGFIPFDPRQQVFVQPTLAGFVTIHLNEFPESLFESEIFGHKKGAFTGAIDNHEGALARCPAYGSVFFDEIGEATLPVQVKLLRVLQDRVYTPVGSREPRRFNGRILAATHRSLPELRASGALRDDFFYRLSSHVIKVPPLRERLAEAPSELGELVAHLCARIAGEDAGDLASEVSAVIARDLGTGYAFPGNVRELEQCVRRVLLTGSCAPDPALSSGLLPDPAELLSAEQLLERYCAVLYDRTRSYVAVAKTTGLDRRTVKKYVARAEGMAISRS